MEHKHQPGETLHWRLDGEGRTMRAVIKENVLDENGQLAYKVEIHHPLEKLVEELKALGIDASELDPEVFVVPESFAISETQAFNEFMIQSYGADKRRRF